MLRGVSDISRTGRLVRSCVVVLSLGTLLIAGGCKDGGAEFRKALRGAANSLGQSGKSPAKDTASNTKTEKQPKNEEAKANSIRSCPEGSKLAGNAYPVQLAQWCEKKDKDGKPVKNGEFRRWDKNGTLLQLEFYTDGQKSGVAKTWNKDGTKRMACKYKNGLKHGGYMLWSKHERLKEKGYFNEDEKYGLWTTYNRSGQILSKITWDDGKKNGPAEIYSRQGALTAKGAYKNNEQSGRWIFFHRNGQRKAEGAFVDGQKHGTWTEYDEDGSPKKVLAFQNGVQLQHQTRQYERASLGRRNRTTRFGNGDILGTTPPRRQPAVQQPIQPPPQRPIPPPPRGADWEPL